MRNLSIRGLVYSALFAAVIVALSSVSFKLPTTSVPITLETLGVMLAGSLLGARYGFLAIVWVIVMVAAGFPVLGGRGGIPLLVGPTAGYIWAWPFAAFFIGYVAERLNRQKWASAKMVLLNFGFGSLLLYPSGVAWLAYKLQIAPVSKALMAGMWPFLPGDFVKALIASALAVAVWRVYPLERVTGAKLEQ